MFEEQYRAGCGGGRHTRVKIGPKMTLAAALALSMIAWLLFTGRQVSLLPLLTE